ncbi:MAG: radical SAM protein [Anaerolineales bacterium]|nr:radical SAM protein [Anaerolineales bacterium]
MKLTGLHLLLTYQCTFECDHCFVFGSPSQTGVMTLSQIQEILRQARETGTIASIYFEGGEPFLYYAVMLKGVQMAKQMGFRVGVVSNAYWANSTEDALEWLRPLADLIEDLSVSSDLYHYSEMMSRQAQNAQDAAKQLGIPVGVISVCQPEAVNAAQTMGTVTGEGAAVMYRGRAVEKLVPRAARQPWETFTECPHEDLREPGRCHLDPLGNLHVCQGISLGNIYETPLKEICAAYDVGAHPIAGPLLAGGPVALVQEYNLPHEENYADACHLCFEARRVLRERFPEILKPDQMYGVESQAMQYRDLIRGTAL